MRTVPSEPAETHYSWSAGSAQRFKRAHQIYRHEQRISEANLRHGAAGGTAILSLEMPVDVDARMRVIVRVITVGMVIIVRPPGGGRDDHRRGRWHFGQDGW